MSNKKEKKKCDFSKSEKKMNISSFDPRNPFFVSSIKCQSLLGKALQEHFTTPEEVASVFSSSPSLRNSSAGANFLTNFKLDAQSAKLFQAVFTPEDCFSVQFAPCLEVFAKGSEDWEQIFNMISNLINNTRYVEASLRSLKITSAFINNEQLEFILSHVKRIEKLELVLGEEPRITPKGFSASISENLPELKELGVECARSWQSLPLLRTKEVRDLIINRIAPRVTAIEEFASLICSIALDGHSANFFANVESFSAILKCFHRSKTSQHARWIASSINNILHYNPSSNKLLNSLPVVEAFSFIIPLASDDAAREWISNALYLILNDNEEAQKKFATPEFFKMFSGMENHATMVQFNKQFKMVLELLKMK
jgi:hypothetical protein